MERNRFRPLGRSALAAAGLTLLAGAAAWVLPAVIPQPGPGPPGGGGKPVGPVLRGGLPDPGRGAAALLAVSFGMLPNIREIKQIIQVSHVYKPRPENTAVYDKLLPVFIDLYRNNKKSFAALNG